MDKNKKVLIIGAGGREHALGWKLKQSAHVSKIYFAPGNGGTTSIGENIEVASTDFEALIKFAKEESIDLTVVGSDEPLAKGIVDEFQKSGLVIYGPSKRAAEIEWSKTFAKPFFTNNSIPTAKFKSFNNYNEAVKYISSSQFPIVIKASGLALGKGVVIAYSREEAVQALQDSMIKKVFGDSGEEVVIEEFLKGNEISIHTFSDGKTMKLFPTSKDHKTIYDNNTGPNTGGMGTVTPVPWIEIDELDRIEKDIVRPIIYGLNKDSRPFVGTIYPGLMLTDTGPKLLEVNSRFGDPETQSYMRILESDLYEIFMACIRGELEKIKIKWSIKYACTVMVASEGYPGPYRKGDEIMGIDDVEKDTDIVVFHSGTKFEQGSFTTNGGRVLGISAVGASLEEACEKVYIAVSKISFNGMQYRKDIGKRIY